MIRCELPGETVGLSFHHYNAAVTIRRDDGSLYCYNHSTSCHIYHLDEHTLRAVKLLGFGRACCSIRDRYVKEEGRKRALHRALLQSGMGKMERTLVWQAYMNRPRVDTPKGVDPTEHVHEGVDHQ